MDELLRRVVEMGKLPQEVATRYLTLSLGEADWEREVQALYRRFRVKLGDGADAQVRKAVACAFLLPVLEPSTKIDPDNPQTLLHCCSTFRQFNDRDWFADFQVAVARDLQIQEWRNQALALGVIDPLEYAPFCRQAFNWLYAEAEMNLGTATLESKKDDVVRRFTNLVWAYGGAAISNIFVRHPELVKKVHNWRTGYFLERAMFNVYSVDQVLKIKRAELDKTNPRLVKRVRVD